MPGALLRASVPGNVPVNDRSPCRIPFRHRTGRRKNAPAGPVSRGADASPDTRKACRSPVPYRADAALFAAIATKGWAPRGIRCRPGPRLRRPAPRGLTAVDGMPQAGGLTFGQHDAPQGQIQRIGGRARAVVHDGDAVAPVAGIEDVIHEIALAGAEQPARAHHAGPLGQGLQDGLLPGQTGLAVDIEGRRAGPKRPARN